MKTFSESSLGFFSAIVCAFSMLVSILLGVFSKQLVCSGADVVWVVLATAAFVVFSLFSLATLLLAHKLLVREESIDLTMLGDAIRSLGVKNWRASTWNIGLGLSLLMLLVGLCWS